MSRLWIDTHIHVSDIGPDGEFREGFLDHLLAVLDADDADLRFVISPDGARLQRVCNEPGGVTAANEFINDLAQRAPGRLFGSCMVNPHFLDESLRMMDLCFGEWGFVQLGEMLQYMMNYEMDSPEVVTLVKRAAEFDVPVQVHLSTSNAVSHSSSHGMAQLDDLCRLADKVPEPQYILAHAVGMPDGDPPVFDKYRDFIEDRYGRFPDNFWVEIRDFDSPGVLSALASVPATRLLSGTDWVTRAGPPFLPYGCIFGVQQPDENPYPPEVASLVGFLRDAGATDDVIDLIGSQNAIGLMHLDV